MRAYIRCHRGLLLMWAATLFIWGDAVLYLLRLHTPFHRLLFKAPLLWIVLVMLVVLPLRFLVSGIRAIRGNGTQWFGWTNSLGGALCLAAVITTHDVLVQHLRIRPGNRGHVVPEDNDAIGILGAHGSVDGAFNVVLDHLSASWSEDEVINTCFGAHDVTISGRRWSARRMGAGERTRFGKSG